MPSTVTIRHQDGLALVMINNPPVNALGHNLRLPLHDALVGLRDDTSVSAIVIACDGRTFIAGADITEFGKPPRSPSLRDLIALLECMDKPTVAAIHGSALGGGLELALGCHYRIADAKSRLGLPEVKLGLLPGAGGTQRLPRLVGPVRAMNMIVSGNPVSAMEAKDIGLVDAISHGNLVEDALNLARSRSKTATVPVSVRDRNERLQGKEGDLEVFDSAVAKATVKARDLIAPLRCAQAVRNALTMKFDDALRAERELFTELLEGEQSAAQRHLFFAERQAAKIDDIDRQVPRRTVESIAVIGAGTMGGGIAMSFANAGFPVTILEMSEQALDGGLRRVASTYDISVARGSLSPETKSKRLALLKGTTEYADLGEADLIIEAAFEDMAVKREIFSRLGMIAKPGAILASNTSYLDIDEIAASSGRAEDVTGSHFFSPANVMRLLEIVRGKNTDRSVIATLLEISKRIGKVPVVVGVCHGFVGNRMLAARSADTEGLLLEGALPQDIDRAFRDFGFPMGPFAMADLAGLDIGWRTRKSLGRSAVIADALCEMGRFGQKTSAGYYQYRKGSRSPLPDPSVDALIAEKSAENNIMRRRIGDEEIIERTIFPMINEGARILDEGIAARASDIDIVWVHGYGFPVGKGGPMFWAERYGIGKITSRLEHWHDKTGKSLFMPSTYLRRMAAK